MAVRFGPKVAKMRRGGEKGNANIRLDLRGNGEHAR
jgi:hypothetical protein